MKTAHEQTNELLKDFWKTTQRMESLNTENHRMDAVIEAVASLILCCVIFSGLGLLYWYQEHDGTDTGVGCIDDCLELLEERK